MSAGLLLALSAGCDAPSVGKPSPASALHEVRVGERFLDTRAFVAQAAFVYPEESREIVRSLLRAEFTGREAERLGLQPDRARVDKELQEFERGLLADLGPEGDFDAWSRARYGRPWAETRWVLGDQLLRNQLYQLCVRVDARVQGRVRMFWLVSQDETEALGWARQLQSGMDPRVLFPASRVRGAEADGSFSPAAARLPLPHADILQDAEVGAVIGPLRFAGDQAWWVGRVAEILPPSRAQPPVEEVLSELDRAPLSPLESRAWFEAMLARYTANDGTPSITAPQPSFVPAR